MSEIDYKAEFRDYTGIDSDDRSLHVFTEDQQVERYARAMAFWDIKRREADGNLEQFLLTSQARVQTISMIDRFPTSMRERIYRRCRDLTGY